MPHDVSNFKVTDNVQVQNAITSEVVKRFIDNSCTKDRVSVGALAENNYSITYWIDIVCPTQRHGLYVKVPKGDLRGLVPSILPIREVDQVMCEAEVDSLRLLNEKWVASDLRVDWITFCFVLPKYNAIVTKRVFGAEAFSIFRCLDIRRRLGFQNDLKKLAGFMVRLGDALGRFHQNSVVTKSEFRLRQEMSKYKYYCDEIAKHTSGNLLSTVMKKLRSLEDVAIPCEIAPTLKGLDIRNVLMDVNEDLYLLDPGKTKYTYREADLARFLMTYRILYWGSWLLLLFRQPSIIAEEAFLRSYYSNAEEYPKLLFKLILLKEQLKHWHNAIDSLQRRPWPLMLKRVVKSVYVNLFFKRQILAQLRTLEQ